MTDKVWLADAEVGTRFGTTRQWVWVQARTNPKFPQPVKLTGTVRINHLARQHAGY